jgi:hypothetical protein
MLMEVTLKNIMIPWYSSLKELRCDSLVNGIHLGTRTT